MTLLNEGTMNRLPDLPIIAEWLQNEAQSAHHRAGLAYEAHEDDLALRLYDHADNLWCVLREVNEDMERRQQQRNASA